MSWLATAAAAVFMFLINGCAATQQPGNPGESGQARSPEPRNAPPRLTHFVQPEYPPALKTFQGTVVIEIKVGADGSVLDVRWVSEPHSFSHAVIQAAKRWEFLPARRDGVPVEETIKVPLEFGLEG